MAALNLLTVNTTTGKPVRVVSSGVTVDFLSIKIGTDGLEIKETATNFDFGAKKLTNIAAGTTSGDAYEFSQAATALALKLNLTGGNLTGALDMGGNKITSLGTPTVGTDATTKTYVDTAIAASGTSAEWQSSVLTATILDPSTISGTPTAGDRYLILGTGAGGWSGKDNQIATYVSGSKSLAGSWSYVTATTGTFTSADDNSNVLYYFGGSTWTVKNFEATTASGFLAKTGFDITLKNLANGKIIVGDGTGTAQAVTPSGDVTMSNTGAFTIAAGAVTASKLATVTDGVTLDQSGSGATLEIKNLGVNTAQLAAAAVTAAKLGSVTDGVTLDQSGSGSTIEIKTGGVGTSQLGSAVVTAAKLATVTDGVTLDQSGSGSTIEIKTGGVGTAQLAAQAVTAAKLGAVVDGVTLTGGAGSNLSILDTESGTNDNAGTISVRQIVYQKSNGHWDLAVATNNAALNQGTRLGLVADATILTTASGNISTRAGALISGFSSLAIGSPVYISRATAGGFAQDLTAHVAGDEVFRVGFAKSATVVEFKPAFLFTF